MSGVVVVVVVVGVVGYSIIRVHYSFLILRTGGLTLVILRDMVGDGVGEGVGYWII